MREFRWRHALAASMCAALLLIFAGISLSSALRQSATVDEPLHAISAYRAVHFHDFQMDSDNPPLWKYWLMLPHLTTRLEASPQTSQYGAGAGAFNTASVMLYQTPGNDGAGFLNRSRVMMVVIGGALLVAIGCWSWQLAGPVAAVTACLLYALDPTVLAHAPLVKNDVVVTFLIFCAAWAVWRVGRRATWRNLPALMLVAAAALTVKFSGVLVAPLAVVLLGLRAIMPQPWRVLGFDLPGRAQRVAAVCAITVAAAAVTWAMIWACYGFRFRPGPEPSAHFDVGATVDELRRNRWYVANGHMPNDEQLAAAPTPLSARLIAFADRHRLLPQAYLSGATLIYAMSLVRQSFLLGEVSDTGWWYYFPVAILVKTPIATLSALTLAALGGVFLRIPRRYLSRDVSPTARLPQDLWTLACLFVPLALYGLTALTTNLNLGIRHILPLFPFAFVLIGIVARMIQHAAPRLFVPLAAAIAIGLAVETLGAYPHYLSFFNAPSRPFRLSLLSDSNLDWGQDLPYVAAWQREHPQEKLYLAYWGPTDPRYYGIQYTNLPGGFAMGRTDPPLDMSEPGVVMISATLLQGINFPPQMRDYYAHLRNRPPDGLVGDSIYLYRWPLKP